MTRASLDQTAGTVGRRQFLKAVATTGALVPTAGFLAACGANSNGASPGGSGFLVVATAQSPWLPAYQSWHPRTARRTRSRSPCGRSRTDGLYTQMVNSIQSKSSTFDILQLDEPWAAQFFANG
ncbi:hypothetical protein ACWEWX_51665 [Streptomyces asiaticus]